MKTNMLIALFLLSGCTTYSPEVAESAILLEQATEANARTRVTMYNAMADNMEQMLEGQLAFDLALRIEKGKDGGGLISQALVREITTAHAAARKKFRKDMAAERAKWLGDPNITTALELSKALNGYIASINEAARALQNVIGRGRTLFKKGEVPQP